MQSAESSQRGFLVSGNEIYLAPYDSAKSDGASAQLERLKRSSRLHGIRSRCCGGSRPSSADKIDEMDRTIALKSDQRDPEALALLRTNRGKALMDEANVFLSSIIRSADERLTTGVEEQRENAARLRWVSIIGGLVIVLVVGGVDDRRCCATPARSRRRATRCAASTPTSSSA